MQFSDDILIRLIVFVLGMCGFWVAKHIRNHKTKDTPLVCIVGFDCHTVVHSDYSKFLGVPVEILGIIYYIFISLASLLFILIPNLAQIDLLYFFDPAISLVAVLFSVYLIFIQIFVLRKGCSWCFVSAFISIFIFILTVFIYDFSSIAQIFLS